MATLVNADAIIAAAVFASTEASRPGLQCVFVDGTGKVAATDGQRLLEVSPLPEFEAADYPAPESIGLPFNGEGVLIPTAQAVAAAKASPKKHPLPILLRKVMVISHGPDSGETFSTDLDTRSVSRFRPVGDRFPDCEPLFPKGDATMTIGFDVEYLAETFGALAKLAKACGGGYQSTVKCEFFKPPGPAVFTLNLANGQQARALVMPIASVVCMILEVK